MMPLNVFLMKGDAATNRFWAESMEARNERRALPRARFLPIYAAQPMAAKLRPRVMLPRRVRAEVIRVADARGRQLQRRVRRQLLLALRVDLQQLSQNGLDILLELENFGSSGNDVG